MLFMTKRHPSATLQIRLEHPELSALLERPTAISLGTSDVYPLIITNHTVAPEQVKICADAHR